MNQRKETVESYLQRGGTVTKIPQVLDTVGSWWNFQGLHQFESLKDDTQPSMSAFVQSWPILSWTVIR